jgi:hypothetical protein
MKKQFVVTLILVLTGSTIFAQNKADVKFQKQLSDVFTASVQLKNDLVSSDAKKTASSAVTVKKTLTAVDMKLLKGEAHMNWMEYLKAMNKNLDAISAATKLDDQRKAFAVFSEALYKSVKTFGIGGITAYYDYCPMANNNEGAYWLSDIKEIRNPYFGDTMLKCGSVKETIQ